MRSSCVRWLSESIFSRCIGGPFPVLLQRPLWDSIIGHSAHAPYGNPWLRLSSRGGRASGLRYPAGNVLPETDGESPARLSRLTILPFPRRTRGRRAPSTQPRRGRRPAPPEPSPSRLPTCLAFTLG